MTAIAAVDCALWDIRRKALRTPLYQLLGGPSRDRVLVYGHANGETVESTVEAVHHYLTLGYKAVRAQCGTPGIPDAYGVGRGAMFYEPAEKVAPRETRWDTARYLELAPRL